MISYSRDVFLNRYFSYPNGYLSSSVLSWNRFSFKSSTDTVSLLFLFSLRQWTSPRQICQHSRKIKKRKKNGGFFEHARSNLFIPHLIVLRYRGDTRVCELGGANINNAFFFSRWVNSRHGLKKEGSESPGEFSVANPKPSALSRITNVTELNPVAVVSDGAVGYCVICNFMHACPKRGERRKWRDFVVRVIARARK